MAKRKKEEEEEVARNKKSKIMEKGQKGQERKAWGGEITR